MSKTNQHSITAHVHGLRNQVAEFEGGPVKLLVGAMAHASYVGDASVLLTVEGRSADGKAIDIEIAVPLRETARLCELIIERAGTAD